MIGRHFASCQTPATGKSHDNKEIQYMEKKNEKKNLKQEGKETKEEKKTEGQVNSSEEGQCGRSEDAAGQERPETEETPETEIPETEPVPEENEEESRVKELEDRLAKEKDDYLRLMAEFDNFRRRTSQEKLELVSSAAADTIKGLLPVLDDFERALKALQDSEDSAAAKEGTELIYNKLLGYLKTKGLAVIESLGKDFDTDLHEAVAQFPVEEKDKKGKVYDVVQTGYTLNGKVIRFAKVVVAI